MRNILLFTVSILPINSLRVFFYKNMFGYKIDNLSLIGFLTIIRSKECKIENCKLSSFNYINVNSINLKDASIGKLNFIKNFNSLNMSSNSSISSRNKFYGDFKVSRNTQLTIKDNCYIGNENYFDLSGNINIQKNCKLLNYCQIWTHGFNSERMIKIGNVDIGENVILENCVTVLSNLKIKSNCLVKISSIVTKSIEEENVYSSNKLFKKN